MILKDLSISWQLHSLVVLVAALKDELLALFLGHNNIKFLVSPSSAVEGCVTYYPLGI